MVDRNTLFARAEPLNPGRAGRMIWLLVILLVSFTAWANWAELEEQVRTRGEIVASSGSQMVQAVDGGVLRNLYVQEGDTVMAGELLAELDRARFAASAAETRAKIINLRATVERLKAELAGRVPEFSDEVKQFQTLAQTQQNLYDRRTERLREERAAIRDTLNIALQELEALEALAETGDAAESEVLNARRRVSELRGELVNVRNKYRSEAQEQLANAQSELDQATQVLNQRQEALEATKVHAPMSGKIKDLAVNTIGAVLQSGDEIMQIVPSDDPLIVEARVSSGDVAFIRPGLEANVKLDAYDFTIYGSMRGEVTYVSPDTIDEDLERDEEPYYRVLIEITKMPKQRGPEAVEVIPGMTATIEIITGKRTVAQYLLKPVLRGSAAALHER
ncbi:MAG: HlyD family type I secretion periplasmic adaptor subunit [Salinisphaeraceae bacterium]